MKYEPVRNSVVVRIDKGEGQNLAWVEVTDFDMRITEEKIERSLTSYRVGDTKNCNKVSGLGLGLYIAQSIFSFHANRMMVSSVVKHGTPFYFSLLLA